MRLLGLENIILGVNLKRDIIGGLITGPSHAKDLKIVGGNEMKCDELKAYGMADPAIDDEYEMYKVSEVDEAIAELKAEVNNLLIQNQELCQALQVMYSVEEYTELKAENESLKAKLEDARATVAFNHLDAVTRERRLKRSLWLARALRARDIQRWWLSVTLAPVTERACSVWNNVERKCLKKAEEYR